MHVHGMDGRGRRIVICGIMYVYHTTSLLPDAGGLRNVIFPSMFETKILLRLALNLYAAYSSINLLFSRLLFKSLTLRGSSGLG